MTRFMLSALILCSGLAALPALGRTLVPVVNHDNVPVVTGTGATPTEDQVRQAIETAAVSQDWEIRPVAPGQLVAVLNVRDKHQVSTDIRYSATSYSIHYRDSANMNYTADRPVPVGAGNGTAGFAGFGGPAIHPFYNRWVDNLNRAIKLALVKLP